MGCKSRVTRYIWRIHRPSSNTKGWNIPMTNGIRFGWRTCIGWAYCLRDTYTLKSIERSEICYGEDFYLFGIVLLTFWACKVWSVEILALRYPTMRSESWSRKILTACLPALIWCSWPTTVCALLSFCKFNLISEKFLFFSKKSGTFWLIRVT